MFPGVSVEANRMMISVRKHTAFRDDPGSSKELEGRRGIAAAVTRAAVLPMKALLVRRSTCCQDRELDEHGGKDELIEG
jgi:hypothetical protein